ncbi:MAG: DUF115 domain-containing protein [Treponema sp.]|nr:DUF115 domain-containing protein [Treponema sp.]
MPVEYLNAKNGKLTCTYDGIYLHSAYDPQKESFRFVSTLKFDFIPENIIIIEPALSYCKKDFEKLFPKSKIIAVRFLTEIDSLYDFDREFYYEDDSKLKNELFNYLGEDGLLNSFFISWPSSAKAFSDKDRKVWAVIKQLLRDCQSILATRQFFAKRWIKNQINFFTSLKNTVLIEKTDVPVLICASGPSLKNCIKTIKEINEYYFIIACSSAIKPLLKNGIVPDLCISTDGGFWAKKHLNCLINKDLTLAVTSEANIPRKLFDKRILPLAYTDGFDKTIFDSMNIKYTEAVRNGTISGTALEFALSITDKNVYMAGLDLESNRGFVHIQPNELEISAEAKDYRLKTKDSRIFSQGRESDSLKIYRNWFIDNSKKFKSRVFRVYNDYNFNYTLNEIQDININELKNVKLKKSDYFINRNMIQSDKNKVFSIYRDLLNNEEFIRIYFPADSISIKRHQNDELKKEFTDKLNSKLQDIESFILRQEKG